MAYEIKGPRSRFTISFIQRKKNNGCFSPPLSTWNMIDFKFFIKTNQAYFAKKTDPGLGVTQADLLTLQNNQGILECFLILNDPFGGKMAFLRKKDI